MTAQGSQFSDLQAAQYEAMRNEGSTFERARDVISVAGAQAGTYLQGQLSQDITAIDVMTGKNSLLLSPQGKLVSWVRVSKVADDSYFIDVDRGWGSAVIERLTKFKLRTKVDISERSDLDCLAFRGPGTNKFVSVAQAATEGKGANSFHLLLSANWSGIGGMDIISNSAVFPSEFVRVDNEVAESLRVECGVPKMGTELTDRTIAAEAGIVENSVSFTKGCYTGQELVARIDSRGSNVSKKLYGFVMGDQIPPQGAELFVDGKSVGNLTSNAWSGSLNCAIALGYVRRGVQDGNEVVVRWDDRETRGFVRDLPLL